MNMPSKYAMTSNVRYNEKIVLTYCLVLSYLLANTPMSEGLLSTIALLYSVYFVTANKMQLRTEADWGGGVAIHSSVGKELIISKR